VLLGGLLLWIWRMGSLLTNESILQRALFGP
jgi:hypothetical protein